MFTRILTEFERRKIKSYLKADGEKDANIRQMIMRYRHDKQRILEDLKLLDQLLAAYEKH
jgi:hypothetical protein